MSDFFKKFKSIFVVEEAASEQQKPVHPAEAGGRTARIEPAAPVEPVPAPAPPPPVSGSVSDKFLEIMLSALEKNNQPGFDYLEYRQALKNLERMPMDEATRYQSAYAMAQTMGVTAEKLIESGRFYLGILAQEETRFNEAHAQQRARLVGNREEEIKGLEAAIQQKTDQISRLQQEIEEHRQRMEAVRAEIEANTLKIEATKADFSATYTNVTENLKQDISKIQQYVH